MERGGVAGVEDSVEVNVTSNESVPGAHKRGNGSGSINLQKYSPNDSRLDNRFEVIKEPSIRSMFQPIPAMRGVGGAMV